MSQEQEDAENEFAHDYGANRLLAAKRARKRAEGDYQLLQNRLVRLRVSLHLNSVSFLICGECLNSRLSSFTLPQLEEEKAQKKISETKKRAQEILALKARNEMVSNPSLKE